MQGLYFSDAKLGKLICEKGSTFTWGGLQLFEGINKPPQGIKAGGIVW